ncbi:hypothetical protein EDB85DRAFT_1902660 [Lactarius pseudohatsudake]|nr:hypothetical protein EDB85DRAFT_1902660 [Lactarius pseudohatsudake]
MPVSSGVLARRVSTLVINSREIGAVSSLSLPDHRHLAKRIAGSESSWSVRAAVEHGKAWHRGGGNTDEMGEREHRHEHREVRTADGSVGHAPSQAKAGLAHLLSGELWAAWLEYWWGRQLVDTMMRWGDGGADACLDLVECWNAGGLSVLREAQGDFIATEYLPEGVTLTQYHHLRLEDANALLKHWIQRQAAGKVQFHFKKVQKADWHHGGEQGSGNYDSSTGAGSSGQSQGDGAKSPSSSADGQQPCEELPTQEDGGILPPHPPNPPPPPPHINPQHHPPTGSPRAGPAHEHPHDPPNNQATADTHPSKRQKFNVHETQHSARTAWLTEWAKQNQSGGRSAGTRAHR